MNSSLKGYINSIQTLGTLDGPGVRFVVFLQGCNLRCGCCHNPETWECGIGDTYTAVQIAEKAEHYREYFGKEGGITLSGGEPLLQAKFAKEVFIECKKRGINTCIDTSGSILNDDVKELLKYTDRVLLDIKYTNDADYIEYAGCSISSPLEFLEYLNKKNIPTTIRQVIIPKLNGDEQNIEKLCEIIKKYPCIDNTELLPFKKICSAKYENMGIKFRFEDFDVPDQNLIKTLSDKVKGI